MRWLRQRLSRASLCTFVFSIMTYRSPTISASLTMTADSLYAANEAGSEILQVAGRSRNAHVILLNTYESINLVDQHVANSTRPSPRSAHTQRTPDDVLLFLRNLWVAATVEDCRDWERCATYDIRAILVLAGMKDSGCDLRTPARAHVLQYGIRLAGNPSVDTIQQDGNAGGEVKAVRSPRI
ncbi:hypothetical protein GGX14DRAFT_648165 [Mycena pura]|uniref:Uncharacterized protein n=1 Tax=Mycena pura TaxID=153505 RepID=A0AAD6YDG6_9AGAR|nr:hypothetical protein GGX14DRAFT_648165 [Mycena pura]